jgi:MSHA biogenesis protein MshE
LPAAQVRRFRAVVLNELDGRLRVRFVDPADLQSHDDILRLPRGESELSVIAESQLLALIDHVHHRSEEMSGLALFYEPGSRSGGAQKID